MSNKKLIKMKVSQKYDERCAYCGNKICEK